MTHRLHPAFAAPGAVAQLGRPTSRVLVLCLVLLGAGALVPVADAHHDLNYLVGGIAVIELIGVLFAIPARWLPSLTLLCTLLIPTDITLLPHVLQGIAIGVLPLAVWMLRTSGEQRVPAVVRGLAILLCVWLALSQAFAQLHTHHGWEWLGIALVALVFAVIATPKGLEPQRFRALFLTITTVLGAYAMLEGFVLHHNVLFGDLFKHTPWWNSLRHSPSYRVSTILGHPLMNGTVFSAAAVLAASDLVERRRAPNIAFARLMILVGAVVATHSRGAAIALAVGLLCVIAFSRVRVQGIGVRRLVLIMSAVVGATIVISGLKARDESSEGQKSAATRVAVITRASQTVSKLEPFGAGPGNSDAYRAVHHLAGSEIALEDSYAELAVSLGPIGALLVAMLLVGVVVVGLRSKTMTGEGAALLTIAIDIGGYNAIEAHRPLLIFISLFIISILTGANQRTEHPGVGDRMHLMSSTDNSHSQNASALASATATDL